jgi:hypothetical protein
MTEHDKDAVDYERKDVDTESVLHIGAIVAVVTILSAVVVLFLFNFMVEQARKADSPNPPLARHEQGRQPPEPRLQEKPFKDIAELRAEERQLLDGYGWVDEKAGVAHIPLGEAMKLVAEKGLPHWAAAPSPSASPLAAPQKVQPR